jgi:hypothetical protein
MADVGASNISVELTGEDVLHAPIGGDITLSMFVCYSNNVTKS